MALTDLHPLSEIFVYAHSPSVGSSAVNAFTVSPVRGKVVKVGCVLVSGVSTSNLLVTTSIGDTAITGGGFTITASGSVAGSMGSATPTGGNAVVEGDIIKFAPSVAAGTTVPATFYAVIRRA